ncbi:uncharacterized protein Z518_05518 [Rhinocladiella mackenziei CBS 650.93]|uniref:Rhinocladiella mackenziei CBS 650.93 unplaced genomic scaffold supercont1.4, whole genome shotgun sequence n=1 Tax=Rhinocladiella mackenziei CBS 650.93 TaxID=1442369 RepID=A0A0D2H2J0_9EURO|nr:uncharacterized protein Z518_05518 [Rhinocladiella mackenziei CBS 650.93]KIX04648.1 hypothetical protein Z518_05518 [Rhinocladiella mackenziei CBS 650.93]
MVYIGKPSRACAHCRRRKLRCDLRKEACGQCVRAGLICTGYRDPDQLRIRDESQSTKQKALIGKSRSVVTSSLVDQHVQVPLSEMARAAFFSHYVSGLAKTYDVLERIGHKSPLDKHLAVSIDAVSLAFFSFQYYSTQASRFAREQYLSALPLVNRAVGTPEVLASDSTLLAVLFLDLFEKIMNNNPRSSDSWMSHVKGAMALLKFRDSKQLKTYIGLRLSVRLFTNMLISCVAADSPVPPALIKLRTDLEPYLDKNDPKWQVSGLVVKYADLRGAIQNGCLSSPDIIARAKRLDNEFSSLLRNLPPSWIYQRIFLPKQSNQALAPYYDVYPDYFTAQTRNVVRIMRILLNDMIRKNNVDIALDVDHSCFNSFQAQFASRIIDAMAKEICSTGPQFSGVGNLPHRIDEFSPIRKLHCYTLLFPYYVAGMYASPEAEVRSWVINQLRFISSNSSIKNASLVADMLESAEQPSPWSVYAMLGSYAFAA